MHYCWKNVADGIIVTGINGTSIRTSRLSNQCFRSDNLLYLEQPSLDLDNDLERKLSLAFDRQLLNLAGMLLTQDRPFAYNVRRSEQPPKVMEKWVGRPFGVKKNDVLTLRPGIKHATAIDQPISLPPTLAWTSVRGCTPFLKSKF
ncbi:hypothetical protein B0H17DRAFT_1144697 [Mycena rosella]|uniref:Uncharacterized protein n=1 Tax=Mycena rosella TaxID=1033263 RepID=A0AAD7G6T2_MYCRO|nr:hypothetical protein B0H17DRAFT_1144697 [Mycena rosella]